jgi:hypothetical protein
MVNRVAGRDLIVAGIAVITSAVTVFLVGERISSLRATVIPLAVLLLSVGFMVVNGLRTQKKL